MSGYQMILKCERIKERANNLGFMFCYPKYRNHNDVDMVGIKPKDQDSLPIYARDTELFYGTIDQLESWFLGVEWARNYDEMLKVSNSKKRERKEQDERNRQLVRLLKDEKVPEVQT
jgi:hypothetical protein